MKKFKRSAGFVFALLLLSFPNVVLAQEAPINAETINLCNRILADIFQDIYDLSAQYPQLGDYGQDSFYENIYGISAIVYEHAASTSAAWSPPYYFGVSITALQDDLFQDQTRYFEQVFPLLGVKLVGYEPKYLKRSQFSISDHVKPYVSLLSDYQQEYLPLRLSIEPLQPAYRLGEEIVFDAVLKNISKQHIFVKPLGPKTLYFLLNNSRWGTRPSEYTFEGEQVVLQSGEELRQRFIGQANYRSKEVTIYGVYNLGFKGVKPHAWATVAITE